MGRSRLGSVYAQGLVELALPEGKAHAYAEELDAFDLAVARDPALRAFWESPGISRGEKIGVLRRSLAGVLSGKVLNLLCVLARKGRERNLSEVCAAYRTLLDEAEGRERGTVRGAVEVPRETVGRLSAALSRFVGRRVELSASVDTSLMGGAVTQVGDLVADGSLRTRLSRLRARLLQPGVGAV